MKNLVDSTAEAVLFLGPLALAFLLLGAPGFRYEQVLIHPHLIAFTVLLPVSFAMRRPEWFRNIIRTPGLLALLCGLGFVVMCTVFVKQFPAIETREIKNILLPMILVFVLLTRYIQSPFQAKRALLAVGIGIVGSLILAYLRFGSTVFRVRAIATEELHDVTGLTYIWFGVSGATLLAISLVFSRQLTKQAFPFLAFFGFGAIAVFASGTRAALMAAVLFIVTLPIQRAIPRRILHPLIALGITAVFFLSIFPELMLKILPPPSLQVLIQGPAGVDRLTQSSGYLQDLAARFWWWHLILWDNTTFGLLFGIDYRAALIRVAVLGHPHNIFVWGRVMGGIPAASLLCLALIRLIQRTHDISVRETDAETKVLSRANLFLYLILFLVFITNSWAGGTYLVLGVNAALTVALDASVRGREKDQGAAPTKPDEVEGLKGHR